MTVSTLEKVKSNGSMSMDWLADKSLVISVTVSVNPCRNGSPRLSRLSCPLRVSRLDGVSTKLEPVLFSKAAITLPPDVELELNIFVTYWCCCCDCWCCCCCCCWSCCCIAARFSSWDRSGVWFWDPGGVGPPGVHCPLLVPRIYLSLSP